MTCAIHSWSWPRRRNGIDVQVCVNCGQERVSEIQFKYSKLDERRMDERDAILRRFAIVTK